jgi:hypothetical protein
MTWVDEELAQPGRIHWLLGVLDHDLTNATLTMPAEELARRYVQDVDYLFKELAAHRAAFADLAQLARDANATLAAVRTVAARIASDDDDTDAPARHSRHDRESVSSAGRGNPPDPNPEGGERR